MAEEELQVEEKGGNKKLIIIIVAVLVLVVGAVGAWLMLSGDDAAPPVEESMASIEATETASKVMRPLYVGMPRPFVFNVADDHRDRLVQIKVQLLVRGEANEELARKHIPLIEGALLRTFSSATVDELSTQKGKESIRANAVKDAQEAMRSITGATVLEQVLFTGFVMQ